MVGVVQDILDRLAQLSSLRSGFEAVWNQVDQVASTHTAPGGYNKTQLGQSGIPAVPWSAQRSKKLYDSTGIDSVDRLSSGVEALVIPQSEYWHGFTITDLNRDEESDAEKRWLQKQRNILFKVRYDADSGWVNASQQAFRSCIAKGNGFIWTEESFDRRAIINYRYLPLLEVYIAEDHLGYLTCFYRYYELTAEQALGKFKQRCPPKVREAAERGADKDKTFCFIHAIQPRGDYGDTRDGLRRSKWASLHISVDEKMIVGEQGFYEMPVIDFRWLPEQVWGEGPLMRCLADVQSLQTMAKNELLAGEQAVKPPLLVANAGVMSRPNSAPNAITMGGINAQGARMVEPMFTGQRLDFATMVLEAKRNQVKNSMYLNLFALLVQNPQMTATEALIRANEKGELLGPAGSRLQQSLSRMVDRERGILERRGLYNPNGPYRIPDSLQGRDIVPQMSGPLDRLRRAKEGEGIVRLLEVVAPLAQADPEVVDNFDADNTVRELRDIFGAPVSVLRDPKLVAERRAQRRQQIMLAQGASIAKDMAAAGKQGSDALAGMKQAGFV